MYDKDKLVRLKQAAIDKDLAAIESIHGNLMHDAIGRRETEYVELLVSTAVEGEIDRLQTHITAATEVRYEYTIAGGLERARKEGRIEIVENLEEEALLVEDIYKRTGVKYQRVQGIPTDDEGVSRTVLPILAEWLQAGCRPGGRHGIYACFANGHARPYVNLLLELLEKEEPVGYGVDVLMQLLARIAKDSDVPKLWNAMRSKKPSAEWYAAAATLSNRKTAPAEIVVELRRHLDAGLPVPVQLIARSRSPRIRDWFRGQLDSKNSVLARVANRVAGKKPPPPPDVVYPAAEPLRSAEVESCEIDIEDLRTMLSEFRTRWGLRLPAWIQNKRKLEFLDVDEAASIRVMSKNGTAYQLWLRLEDYDTIELRLSVE